MRAFETNVEIELDFTQSEMGTLRRFLRSDEEKQTKGIRTDGIWVKC